MSRIPSPPQKSQHVILLILEPKRDAAIYRYIA
jgi:hypothetical protein